MKSGADTYSAAIADARNYIEWQIEPFMPYLRGQILEVGIGHGSFAPLLRQCGLPRVTFHSLRHSSISSGARAGVDPAVMQRRAGHSTLSMTLGVYRHVLEEEDREATRLIDERLTQERGAPPTNEPLGDDGQNDGQPAD